jgi:hypothetical protein
MTFSKGQNPQGGPSRRTLITSVAAAGAAVAAGLYRFTDLFVKHYVPTPYDDVLAALLDREHAAKLGALVTGTPAPTALAARLRAILKPDGLNPNGLTAAAEADAAAGRIIAVDGWLLPESVALLSALAARA